MDEQVKNTASQASKPSGLVIEDYCDIWRGAFYSVVLGLIYSKNIFGTSDWPKWEQILFSGLLTAYIVLDGMTRYNSRKVIRRDQSSVGIFWELSLLIVEMVGVLFLTIFAINPTINLENVLIHTKNNMLFVSIFGICNFVHNIILMYIDRDWNLKDYLKSFRDGFDEKTLKKWMFRIAHWKDQSVKVNSKLIEDIKEGLISQLSG